MSTRDVLYPSDWPEIPETLILEDQEEFSDGSKEFLFRSTISESYLRISGPHSDKYTISVRFDGSIHDVYCSSTDDFITRLTDIYTVFGADQLIEPSYVDNYEYIKAIDFDEECVLELNTSLEVTREGFDEAEFASFLDFQVPDHITEGGKLCLQFTLCGEEDGAKLSEIYVFENYDLQVEHNFNSFSATFIPNPEVGIEEYIRIKTEEDSYEVTTNYVDPEYKPQIFSEFV